jgi:enoyl-CoA hydratase
MAPLEVEAADGVAVVTLNRPEKRNALSIELRTMLQETFRRLPDEEQVRCIVLTGAGAAFCAGMDVTQFGGDRDNKRRLVESSTGAFRAIGNCPKPIVCAVNGPAIAGGFALALITDIRLAGEAATFGFAEMRLGIAASYAALRSAVSPAIARELCLTGRLVEADEALRLGIVSEVVPDDRLQEHAVSCARRIAGLHPKAVAETKRRILLDMERSFRRLFDEEERVFREELLEAKRPEAMQPS